MREKGVFSSHWSEIAVWGLVLGGIVLAFDLMYPVAGSVLHSLFSVGGGVVLQFRPYIRIAIARLPRGLLFYPHSPIHSSSRQTFFSNSIERRATLAGLFCICCSENTLFFHDLHFVHLGRSLIIPKLIYLFASAFIPFKMKTSTIALSLLLTVVSARSLGAQTQRRAIYRTFGKREVPQEHSHEKFLTAVSISLNLNNPDKIADPVFGLLGAAVRI